MKPIDQHRFFLKDTIRQQIDFRTTDQHRGLAMPPVQKPYDAHARQINLPRVDPPGRQTPEIDLATAIVRRKSRRRFSAQSMRLDALAFLLWATQGMRRPESGNPAFRTVPSAGARHSFETYLFVMRVDGLEPGLYRYLPIEHRLLFENAVDNLEARLADASLGQRFVAGGAATFVWTTVAYRMEWRYWLAAHRVILIDVGHVCQNLYLACEAIGAGTCAIGAYDQAQMDHLLGVDGQDEFTIYLAPVGMVR
jgi:SagB-type dehydrogenase family enzyme